MASDSSIDSIHTYLLKIGNKTDIYKDIYASSSDKPPYFKNNTVDEFIANTADITRKSQGTDTSMIISNKIKEEINPSPDNIIYVALANKLKWGLEEYIREFDFEKNVKSYLPTIVEQNIKYAEVYDKETYKQTKTKTKLLSDEISKRIHKNVYFIYHKDITFEIQKPSNYQKSNDNIYFYINIGDSVRKKNLKVYLRPVIVINTDFIDSDSDTELTKSFTHFDSFKIDDSQAATKQADTSPADTPPVVTPQADTPQADTPQEDTPQADTPQEDTPQATIEESSKEDETRDELPGILELSSSSTSERPEIEKYMYNPKDIHALLKKYKITNKEKDDDTMNGDYLIGFPFGVGSKYRNIYKIVEKTDKYFLSGRLEQNTDSKDSGKIKWFNLM